MNFVADIRPLFREADREAMLPWLDLWTHEDVRQHAESILARLIEGDMPCDEPWPDSEVALFEAWVREGMLP